MSQESTDAPPGAPEPLPGPGPSRAAAAADPASAGDAAAADHEASATAAPADTAASTYHPPRWLLPALTTGIVALVVLAYIGNAMFSRWIETHPLLLISFSPANKFLLLASSSVALVPFMVWPAIRLFASDPIFFAMGRIYGDRAIEWGKKSLRGSTPIFDQLTDPDPGPGVRRLIYGLIVVAPNNPVCLIAGATQVPVRLFVILNVIGTFGRLALLRWLAGVFESELNSVVDVVSGWQQWLLPISVVVVLLVVGAQLVGHRRGLLSGATLLDDVLEDEDEPEGQAS